MLIVDGIYPEVSVPNEWLMDGTVMGARVWKWTRFCKLSSKDAREKNVEFVLQNVGFFFRDFFAQPLWEYVRLIIEEI